MRCSLPILTALVLVCASTASAADPAPRKKVLIIGIDGCRTDALLAAKAPHLHALIREGAFADNTRIIGPRRTKADTVSGPGWSNLLTGVWPDKHGVNDNKFQGTNYQEYPHFFRRLKESRPAAFTASLVTWKPIADQIVSAANVSLVPHDGDKDGYPQGDVLVARKASQLLAEQDPDALFVYLGNVDETGHKHGFHPRVPEYVRAIEAVDGHVGEVLKSLHSRRTFAQEDWLTLVCTDHGGQGTKHGGGHDDPEITTVFLIVSGRAAQRGKIEQPTSQVDVVATALTHLDVPIDPRWKWDGRAVGLRAP